MPGKMIWLMTCRIRLILAGIILILLSIIVINMLLVSTPVVIQMEGDTFKIIEIPFSYTTKDVYIILVSGVLGGIAFSQILLCLKVLPFEVVHYKITEKISDPENMTGSCDHGQTDAVLRALEGDERKIVKIIMENKGEILQNELVNTLNFPKAKVSRILMNLERRKIIIKKKYGLTNHISLADDIRGEIK